VKNSKRSTLRGIKLGTYVFGTKSQAREFIRRILYAYRPTESLGADDQNIIVELLQLHPQAEQKIGCGVDSVQIENNQHGTVGFWVTRVDGSRTDFSYLSCLRPRTHHDDALAAFREAIQAQVTAFRSVVFANGPVQCPITGIEIRSVEAHIDHAVPFMDLITAFLIAQEIGLDDVLVSDTHDGSTRTVIMDAQLRDDWKLFHTEKAVLRAVHRTANLSILRRGLR